MKQSDDVDKFFKKYGFTANLSMPHPIYKDRIFFEGLEANYVSSLQNELEHFKRCFRDSIANNEMLLSRESWRLRDELKKSEHPQKERDED